MRPESPFGIGNLPDATQEPVARAHDYTTATQREGKAMYSSRQDGLYSGRNRIDLLFLEKNAIEFKPFEK